MTPQQIAKRVQEQADARFGEVVERLLSILDVKQKEPSIPEPLYRKWVQTPFGYIPSLSNGQLVAKWIQTGLLDDLPDFVQITLAEWLEDEAHRLIDWQVLEHPDPVHYEKTCERNLRNLRHKAICEYELVQLAVKKSQESGLPIDHFTELYHRHGFS